MGHEGKLGDWKGRAEEAAGALLDDDELRRRGRADRAAGKLKGKVGEIVDGVKDHLTGEGRDEARDEEDASRAS